MCTRNGNCELQKLAIEFNIDELDFPRYKRGKDRWFISSQ